jgi:hypothetical protein
VADAAVTVLMVSALALCGLALAAVATVGGSILVDRLRRYLRTQRVSAGFAFRVRR